MKRPGHYPFKIGEFDAVVLSDGFLKFAPVAGRIVVNAELEEFSSLLESHFLPTDHSLAALNTLLLRAHGKTILFDVGYGIEGTRDNGHQMENLRAADYRPRDIDVIFLSHAHPDHIAGLVGEDKQPAYPNADVYMHEREFQFWSEEADPSEFEQMIEIFQHNMAPLKNRLKFFHDEEEILPGVHHVPAPGHTPGHSAFRIASDGSQLLLTMDAANHQLLFLRNPEYHFGLDFNKPLAVESRKKLLEQAASEQLPILAYHFPFPGLGYIKSSESGFEFIPSPWEKSEI